MPTEIFSKKDAIRLGWEKTNQHLGLILGALVLSWILPLVPRILGHVLGFKKDSAGMVFVNSVELLLSVVFSVGVIRLLFHVLDNKNPRFEDLFSGLSFALNAVIVQIVYVVILVLGLLLFIIPGIYWGIGAQYAIYFVIDQGESPLQAFKRSLAITRGIKIDVLIFSLCLLGICLLGLLALGVGLLWAVPVSWLANLCVYRKLNERVELFKAGL